MSAVRQKWILCPICFSSLEVIKVMTCHLAPKKFHYFHFFSFQFWMSIEPAKLCRYCICLACGNFNLSFTQLAVKQLQRSEIRIWLQFGGQLSLIDYFVFQILVPIFNGDERFWKHRCLLSCRPNSIQLVLMEAVLQSAAKKCSQIEQLF